MTEDPVEILVQMAKSGEIDPWNVDIVDVTDRFFAEMERQRTLDLRVSGRTLFFAATLLRIKSDYLKDPDENSEMEFSGSDEGWFGEGENEFDLIVSSKNPINQLEYEIKRRLERKQFRKQPVTLYDLINLLRNAEKEERRRQRESFNQYDSFVFAEDVVGIAHEEAYFHCAEEVYEVCVASSGENDVVTLDSIADGIGWPKSQVYIPLLFLMHEGKVRIWQEEFFGDLFVKCLCAPDHDL